jgi:uncharacterized membrane protein
MNSRVVLRTVICICIMVIFAVVITYMINFRKMVISDNSQDWGTFGDFFGGVLNPLIGFLNLIVLVYIPFAISDAEERRNRNELASQKQFALYSLKHDSLKELNKILEQVRPELMRSEKESQVKILLIRNELSSFILTTSYLFPSLASSSLYAPLRESITKISEISSRYFESEHQDDPELEVLPELRKFNDLRDKFIIELQNQILS